LEDISPLSNTIKNCKPLCKRLNKIMYKKSEKGVGGITRKGMRVQELLLERIEKEEYPISTRQLALALQLSWHTVQEYCLKLQLKKKIHGFRTAGSYLWTKKEIFSEKDDKTTILRTLLDEQLNEQLNQEINSEIRKLREEIASLKQKARENRITAQFVAGGENK
jgi:DNA-binding transcriptional regulator YhcF (GntR family)